MDREVGAGSVQELINTRYFFFWSDPACAAHSKVPRYIATAEMSSVSENGVTKALKGHIYEKRRKKKQKREKKCVCGGRGGGDT